MLSDTFKDKPQFYMWRDVFPLLYGGEVEEVAKKNQELTDMLTGEMFLS